MWLWSDSTSGFTVTYNVPDDPKFENWPELTHHFGFQNGTENQQITFEKDFSEISICVDDHNSEQEQDFEGFKFLQYDEVAPIEILPTSSGCSDGTFKVLDMTDKRLIGFKVIISDHLGSDGRYSNIRQICPLVDAVSLSNCDTTEFYLEDLHSMSAVIGGGPTTQVFKSDMFSSFYYNQDGFSFCKDAYTLEFSPVIEWFGFDEDTHVMTVDSALSSTSITADEERFVAITIKFTGDIIKAEVVQRIALVCDSSDTACSATVLSNKNP